MTTAPTSRCTRVVLVLVACLVLLAPLSARAQSDADWGSASGPRSGSPKSKPDLGPRPAKFSAYEIARYEQEIQQRRNRVLIGVAGATVLAALATGVTLLAVGLYKDQGNIELTTTGIGCLGLATVLGFGGLELVQW